MIRGIKFASVACADQDRALAFWTEKMGFAIATDQPFDGGQRWIEVRIPGADTRLVLFTPTGQQPGGFSNISFWSDDVDATYRELSARGVEFTTPPKTEPWGTSSIFQDSEGNQFHLGSR
jgi:predicted enzyme related to lactoylglutathione lyase